MNNYWQSLFFLSKVLKIAKRSIFLRKGQYYTCSRTICHIPWHRQSASNAITHLLNKHCQVLSMFTQIDILRSCSITYIFHLP